jgi:hypothetical protein
MCDLKEVEELVSGHGFTRPDRGDLDTYADNWREGKPDYAKVDLAFLKGKSMNHKPGSIEMTVENLVKKWEMEMTHLPDSKDWTTVELGEYCVQVNGGREIQGLEAATIGTYNWIMENASKELYDAKKYSFDASHKLFRGALADGFPWELLEVYSGPPKVAFSWRHWGEFSGQYEGRKGRGERVELRGFTIATMSASNKIAKIEAYTKYDDFLRVFQDKEPSDGGNITSGCPIKN